MTKARKALISGITGQDGSYLAELLLAKGYDVHGVVRRSTAVDPVRRMWRIRHLLDRVTIHLAEIDNLASMFEIASRTSPDEWYHLAARSFVSHEFSEELGTLQFNIGTTYCALSALLRFAPPCRFFFAASSEVFGRAEQVPQNEATPFHPRSAYGVTKAAGFDLVRNFRERDGVFAVSGMMYNHESPRRGFEFVTRKITSEVARIRNGHSTKLVLGNLEASRDWGHARDFVQGMWAMLQQPEPHDYVLATGKLTSVREFAELAFTHVGLDYREFVTTAEVHSRPDDSYVLLGDASRARRELRWTPEIDIKTLVTEMVDNDMDELRSASA